MKKIFMLMLTVLLLAFSFVSCNNDNGSDNEDGNNEVKYSVKWFSESGEELKVTEVKEGEVPSYSYSVNDTDEWDYTFIGWANEADGAPIYQLPVATGDASYYAIVNKVKKNYVVTFDSNGGTSVDPATVEYGSKVNKPEDPTYEGHRFVGWSADKEGKEAADFESAITKNTTYYAIWNEVVDIKALLKTLLSDYAVNPMSYLPKAMVYDYGNNLIDPEDIVSDYSSFVSTSDICYGFGEQWRMVLDNIRESTLFFNALSVVEGLTTTSIAAFNNYIDSNPSDTAKHSFKSGIYDVTVDFDGETISYVLGYTAEFPALGEQTAEIALSMEKESGDKTVRVQIGDANALKYTVTDNSYTFAIKYLGVRRAMFSAVKDDEGNVSGKIFEYLTVSSVEIASAAEFFVTDDYVSVVGNKADGMIGFTGYINELYDKDSGKMLGYEVKEELSAIVYNTLWFNLSDVGGISSIKYLPKTENESAKLYVNGNSSEWTAKNVGFTVSLTKGGSRRFDIEFRTQYVYSYDEDRNSYVEHAISVPMIFVQEEMLDSFTQDVLSQNGVAVSVLISATDVQKITDDYKALIPVFSAHKDEITVDAIIAYIGEKITTGEGDDQ
ncbi:MAG: InlB B-repeat-containing protein [Clostridia bacterium]|nr:InlB B-repeat-containing protein [Clostridia bacterium]